MYFMKNLYMRNMTNTLTFCFLLLNIFILPAYAQVTAELNRNPITEQETVTLTLSIGQQANNISPDLTPLRQDFDVLGQSQSSQVQISNDDQYVLTQWQITLFPKRTGDLVIPPIQIGKARSEAIVLTVKPVDKQQADGEEPEVFLHVETDADSVYVQAQLLVTVKLFTRVSLQRYELTDIELPGVSITKLGEDSVSETLRGNQRYTLLERRYALFPESSGRLEIPSLLFSAMVNERQQRRRSLFDDFFTQPQGRTVRVRSDPVNIEVKPKPADFPGAWLAVKALSLRENWQPNPPQFKVGEPVTRTLSLTAFGVDTSLLPELNLAELEAIKQYPDQPQSETKATLEGLSAVRQDKFALVPSHPGAYTLPEIRIPWWDTRNEKVQYASIPAREIEVMPATNTPSMTPQAAQQPATSTTTTTPQQPASAPNIVTVTDSTWQWISAALGLGWFLTLLLWWAKRRPSLPAQPPEPSESPQLAEARRALKQACRDNNPQAAKNALLAWAKVRWPGMLINSVSKIGAQLEDSEAQAALRQFDAYLYAPQTHDWNASAFWQLLSKVLTRQEHARPAAKPDLPRLYPQTLKS
jgi:hypothetical protein